MTFFTDTFTIGDTIDAESRAAREGDPADLTRLFALMSASITYGNLKSAMTGPLTAKTTNSTRTPPPTIRTHPPCNFCRNETPPVQYPKFIPHHFLDFFSGGESIT
jgi:hypothetical protein